MKKYFLALAILILGGLIWYLFIKPYDYIVRFKTKTYTGVVNQTLKSWSNSLENSEITFSENLNKLNQKIVLGSDTYNYEWVIEPITDTTSIVKVYAWDSINSLENKIKIPFTETTIEKKVKENIIDFNSYLTEHIKKFRVRTITKAHFPPKYVAYISIKTTQINKVVGMMENYPILDNMMSSNDIKSDGMPFVEITHWDKSNDSIHYNFCYPIIKQDNLPVFNSIRYKEFKGGNMLKAEYNGNYITSDRAWYKIIDFADQNNIPLKNKPIEIFYTNPNFGGDELNWKAEIYLPIDE